MRISDWSSDVCSSDLLLPVGDDLGRDAGRLVHDLAHRDAFGEIDVMGDAVLLGDDRDGIGVRSEERRVGKDVSVRVDLGGRRIIKKKNIVKIMMYLSD